jgi:hypothetical protein
MMSVNYKVTTVIGIAAVLSITYVLYISPYINSLNNNNSTRSLLDDIKDPLEQFRYTHLKEYVERYTMVEGEPYPLDYMARVSKYIVIGKFVTKGSEYKAVTPNFNFPITHAVVDVEQELTGNLKGNRIEFKASGLSNKFAGVYYGDKILVFIADKEPDSVFGDNYYLLMGKAGIYKIVDGKAYGYYYDGIPLDDLIKIIQDARADRIKDLAVNSDYAIVGRIKGIEKVSISPDITEVNEHTISANVTVEVYNAIPSYKGKEFTFFVYTDVIQDCKDRTCLFFIKYGTHEDEVYKRLPPERLNKLAKYYLYPTWSVNDGVYRVMDDGKTYGKEYPEGIMLDELLARIKEYKGIN